MRVWIASRKRGDERVHVDDDLRDRVVDPRADLARPFVVQPLDRDGPGGGDQRRRSSAVKNGGRRR